MSTVSIKVFSALSIFVIILLAGWYPFKKREEHLDFAFGETLATGVFLGAALLHMLPEAHSKFQALGFHYPYAFIITGLVFLLFLWFEHLGKELYHHGDANHPAFALLAWLMLSFHSLVIASALGYSQEYAVLVMLYLAIITHKWAESFAIAIQLSKSSLSPWVAKSLFILFAFMTPLGVFIGWYFNAEVNTNSIFDPILMSLSAGTFLYLGTLHGLERCVLVEKCCNLRDFSFVIIGFLIMALVAFYL
jgi:zinc transporter ZupT